MQVDELALGASVAVILVRLWLKEYEFAFKQETTAGTEKQPMHNKNVL